MSTTDETTVPTTSGGCGCGGCGCGGDAAEAEPQVVRIETGTPAGTEPSAAAGAAGVASATGPVGAAATDGVERRDLDVRPLSHGERHERVFAAVAALVPGEAFVLAVDHDPVRLRARLDAEQPGELAWQTLAAGPEVWRVQISRVSCC